MDGDLIIPLYIWVSGEIIGWRYPGLYLTDWSKGFLNSATGGLSL